MREIIREAVLCKDCKYMIEAADDAYTCLNFMQAMQWVDPEYACPYGEARTKPDPQIPPPPPTSDTNATYLWETRHRETAGEPERPQRTVHELKLSEPFIQPVYDGRKTFEVRENDRGFQSGDLVRFIPVSLKMAARYRHPIRDKLYEITYVLSGWGIREGYVAFGIREAEDGR